MLTSVASIAAAALTAAAFGLAVAAASRTPAAAALPDAARTASRATLRPLSYFFPRDCSNPRLLEPIIGVARLPAWLEAARSDPSVGGEGAGACGSAGGVRRTRGDAATARGAVARAPFRHRARVRTCLS